MHTYAVDADGAVLVRPDGYVAWRSYSGVDSPRLTLPRIIGMGLGREHQMASAGERLSGQS
jgi:putative polyketide hydroxylase/tetracenomycin A2 monooxygenase-dioxygenase